MMEIYPIILGGKKKETAEIADIRFPYTGEIYARVCQASQGDLNEAVTAAVRGFEKTRQSLIRCTFSHSFMSR